MERSEKATMHILLAHAISPLIEKENRLRALALGWPSNNASDQPCEDKKADAHRSKKQDGSSTL